VAARAPPPQGGLDAPHRFQQRAGLITIDGFPASEPLLS